MIDFECVFGLAPSSGFAVHILALPLGFVFELLFEEILQPGSQPRGLVLESRRFVDAAGSFLNEPPSGGCNWARIVTKLAF